MSTSIMSTTVSAPDEAARRGTVTVPAAVVAKIAAQAAYGIDVVGSASGGVLGLGARRNFDERPQAQAQLFGNTAVLTLDLGITYPTPLRATGERIRAHVSDRVAHLTGFEVEQVDLEISWLHPGPTATRGALL